jgi:hypothetical protein
VPVHQVFAISVGDSVSDGVPAAGAGNIEAVGAVDEYAFSGVAGQQLWFNDAGTAPCCSLDWQVFAPDGTSLANDAFGPNRGPAIFTLPATGRYTVVVSGSGTATGTYGFSLVAVPVHQVFAISVGDSVSDGVPAAGAGNIEAVGAIDEYTFSATAGQIVQLTDAGTAPCCSLDWQVFAPDGTSLANDAFGPGRGPATFTSPEKGMYTIVVSGSGTATGTYGFSLSSVPGHQVFGIAIGDTVSDGVPAAGAGNIEAVGSVDEYTFSATAGQIVQFNDPGTTPCCNLQWQLYAPDGTSLGTQPFGPSAGQLFVSPATGTYTIVASAVGAATGTYSFSLSTPPTQVFAVSGGVSVSDGVPSAGAGNIETAGAVDEYTFSGVTGEIARLIDPGATPCCTLRWQLFAPDGTTVGSDWFGNSAGQSFTLNETGTYVLVAFGPAAATGTYGFQLLTAPSAPTIGHLSVVGTTGSVTFTPPASSGGSSITGYAATCTSSNGGATRTRTGTASPLSIASLSQAKTYVCTVVASNAYGSGAQSAPSNPIVVPTVPAAPTSVKAVSGSTGSATGSLSVSFTAPTNNGGAAINSYTATCTSGNGGAAKTQTATTNPFAVTGVTTGKTYTCVARATNVVGTGAPSMPSPAVIVGSPAAPTNVNTVSGSTTSATGSVTVSFTAGANNGAAITSYSATCTSTNGGISATKSATSGPLTVAGLTTAKTYSCTAKATNTRGAGLPSTPSPAVVVGSPAAPTNVKAVAGSATSATGSLVVSFTAGANNGAAITSYSATCTSTNGGISGTKSASSGPLTVAGLTTAKTYSCTAKATNTRGAGLPSTPSPMVIVGSPTAPTNVTVVKPSSGQFKLSFTPGANNGAAVTSYSATCTSTNGGSPGAITMLANPLKVTGVTPGKSYTCAVNATNTRGIGLLSAPSAAIVA